MSSDAAKKGDAIVVEHLTKRFDIGALQQPTMLREQLISLLRNPFRRRNKTEILTALNDVSFRVPHGEIVGIIGSNGAGKSTLLKVLSRITHPTSGHVHVNGRVASLLEVGTGFHEELTGRENIYLNGSILGMKRRQVDEKLDAIVAFSGVERFIDTPIKRFSSGMRLRLGFAVAAHLDPDILIVDEVLAVGDAAFQRKCINAMEGLRGGGRTVLFVSHNMAAVENLCSRAIWIDGGKLREDGPTSQVIGSYMSAYAGVHGSGGSVDLRTFPARRGSGDVRYTGIRFLDASFQPRAVTRSGDPLTVRLEYVANVPLRNLLFGFRIYSELGTLVTETSTRMHNLELPALALGPGYMDLQIDALNLMPGRYYLSAGITTIDGPIHDTVENCASLDIEPGLIFGSSRITDTRYGFVFFPQRWHLDGVRALGKS
jgi:lipopolysaccharide transport system ATP-binding protein